MVNDDGVLGPIRVDYNNIDADHRLVVKASALKDVPVGTPVVIEDPGDPTRYTATVVESECCKVTLDVDWTSPIEVVDPETDVW